MHTHLADCSGAAGVIKELEGLLSRGVLLFAFEARMDPGTTAAEVGNGGVDQAVKIVR